MRSTFYAALFIFLMIFSVIEGKNPIKRSALELKLAYWGQASSEQSISLSGIKVEANTWGMAGKLIYIYHFDDSFGLTFSIGILGSKTSGEISLRGISQESIMVAPILLGARYYLSDLSENAPVKPYVSGMGGVYIGSTSANGLLYASNRTETTAGFFLGAGMDFLISNLIKLNIETGYNFVTDFSYKVGARSNYSGPEISLGFGFLI